MFQEYTKNLDTAKTGKTNHAALNPKPDPSRGIFDYDRSKILLLAADQHKRKTALRHFEKRI